MAKLNKDFLKYIGFGLLPLFCYIVILLIASSVIKTFDMDTVAVTFIADSACILIGGLIYWKTKDKLNNDVGGYELPFKTWVVSAAAIIVFCLVWYFGQVSATLVYSLVQDSAEINYQSKIADSELWIYLVLTLIVAPCVEELLMRGFAYPLFKKVFVDKRVGAVVSAMLVAFIFAALHGTLTHFIPTFMFGLFLGMVREYTGQLRWCIAFHAAYNTMAVVLAGIPVISIFAFMPVTLLCDFAILALILSAIVEMPKCKKKDTVFVTDERGKLVIDDEPEFVMDERDDIVFGSSGE